MYRGLPCSDLTTDSDSRTPTSGPEPTDDSSSPGLVRKRELHEYITCFNMMLDDKHDA
jgi:hypothetical protein